MGAGLGSSWCGEIDRNWKLVDLLIERERDRERESRFFIFIIYN